jgi:hypothetical protein
MVMLLLICCVTYFEVLSFFCLSLGMLPARRQRGQAHNARNFTHWLQSITLNAGVKGRGLVGTPCNE